MVMTAPIRTAARRGSRRTIQPSSGMRMGIVLRMTEALTALVLATPQTRNKDAAPGSSKPITKGRQPTLWKSRACPAASANRSITPAPIKNRNPVISATARASIIAFWAMTVEAQQADAKTRARAGMIDFLEKADIDGNTMLDSLST